MKRHHRSHTSHRRSNPDSFSGGFVEGIGVGLGLAVVAGVAHYWMRAKPLADKQMQDVAVAAQAMGHSAGVKLGADLQAAAMLAQTAAPTPAQLPAVASSSSVPAAPAQLPAVASSSSVPAAPAASARSSAVPTAVVDSVSTPSLASASSPAAAGLYRTYGIRPSGILGGGVSSFVPASL